MATSLSRRIYAHPRWKVVRLKCFNRDGWKCTMPGCGNTERLECDHKIPLRDLKLHPSILPAFELSNLRTICRECHMRVTRASNGRHHKRKVFQSTARQRLMKVAYGAI